MRNVVLPAVLVFSLGACAEPLPPTVADPGGPVAADPMRPISEVPSVASGELGDLADGGHCHFVWHELPYDDTLVLMRPISEYYARVYMTYPENEFPDDPDWQVVDLKVPPSKGWEAQYLDIEDDVVRWDCPAAPDAVRLVVEPDGLPGSAGYTR